MSARPQRLRLFDILNMIAYCERVLAGKSLDDFVEDDTLRLAVERALEIISEASRHVDPDNKAEEPGVDWERVAAFGTVARHGYDAMSVTAVFATATRNLANLKTACSRLYADLKRPADPWPDAGA